MPTKTKIEWADYITNPLKANYLSESFPMNGDHSVLKTGHVCERMSEGCAHCWASAFNVRLGTGLPYTNDNLNKVTVYLDEAELHRLERFQPRGPFKNGRARAMVFPCDMTDLFGSWNPQSSIERIFNVMAQRSDLDFMILTKRLARMLKFLTYDNCYAPLQNVILGVSVENPISAMQRWMPMHQLSERGWKIGISYEPALQPIHWDAWKFISVLICGGESGPKARPMHPDCARSARDFCETNNIPFFFKQWGEYLTVEDAAKKGMYLFSSKPVDWNGTRMVKVGRGMAGHELDGKYHREMPNLMGTGQNK